jgi:hypothetical protein
MTSPHRAGSHERVLSMVFEHPMSRNIEWRDFVHMLGALGNVVEEHNGSVHFTVNGETLVMHRPQHKDLNEEQVTQVRHFFRKVGIAPSER